ncbi:hypothetical protein C2S53_018910 [Perilla frutescens var. hirtella]|uniref:Uncharacterized protein n=1 Tax=Perilla frutescens var. hirtella TaxID=608512 RepID=A0AAD4IT07_PERFH|nr:hypothetical protein C2S53_018910 [Perilla frutescens var. hirtella]
MRVDGMPVRMPWVVLRIGQSVLLSGSGILTVHGISEVRVKVFPNVFSRLGTLMLKFPLTLVVPWPTGTETPARLVQIRPTATPGTPDDPSRQFPLGVQQSRPVTFKLNKFKRPLVGGVWALAVAEKRNRAMTIKAGPCRASASFLL